MFVGVYTLPGMADEGEQSLEFKNALYRRINPLNLLPWGKAAFGG